MSESEWIASACLRGTWAKGAKSDLVENNLDALLTALYVDLEDRVLPAVGWTRDHQPGRKPVLSDAELMCLVVAQHLLGVASERRWVRYARTHLLAMFPDLPGQSGFGKRLRRQAPLLAMVITELARDTASWHDVVRLVDSTPLPCAASRETVKRSDLAGHAGYGYCASHSRFFWGLRLYLITTADGLPILWALANPKLGERDVVRALLDTDHQADHPLIRTGQVILADKGFAGRDFEAFVHDTVGAHLLRPDRRGEPTRHGRLARYRQWIEAIIDTLKGQLTLEHHAGRTLSGVYARVAARLLALTAAIWHNHKIDAPVKRSLMAYDH